jgi:hypothetical protein
MDYDLHWINGPAPGDAPNDYERRAHFHASEAMMAALHHEMERQGMIGHELGSLLVGDWETKFEASGQIVTSTELVAALATSTNDPAAPPESTGMSMAEWRERWEQWLDFLVGAMHYGGFRIERSKTT